MTLGLLLLTFIGSCVNLYQSWGDRYANLQRVAARHVLVGNARWCPSSRALRAQGAGPSHPRREQLRHYVLTGKLLDPRLTVQQIVGLRFASTRSSSRWPSAPPTRTSR